MTAKKLKFKNYRKWHRETVFYSPFRPIKYSDGGVGGNFKCQVELSSGDLNHNKNVEPTRDVYAVEAILHYKPRKERVFTKVYSSMSAAMLVYQRIRDDIKANTPTWSIEPWGTIPK